MKLLEQFDIKTAQWEVSSAYERFEQIVVLILTGLIIVVIAAAIWHLAIKILFALILTSLDPTDPTVFQTVFGWTRQKAEFHMLQVHNQGKSLLARTTMEKAEHFVHQLQKYTLHATMEREQ